jgi:hypothetical protein
VDKGIFLITSDATAVHYLLAVKKASVDLTAVRSANAGIIGREPGVTVAVQVCQDALSATRTRSVSLVTHRLS